MRRCVACHNWYEEEDMQGRLCVGCFDKSASKHAAQGKKAPLPRATQKRLVYGGIAFVKDDGLDVTDLSGDSIHGRRIG